MSGHFLLGLGGLGSRLVGQSCDLLAGRSGSGRLITALIDSDKAALNTLAEKACQSYHLGAQPAEKLLLNPGEWERLVPPGVQPELRRAGCGAIRMLGRLPI